MYVAGHLAGSGYQAGRLVPEGLTAGLLTATVERGGLLAGAERAEVSAVDQIAGVERATGEAWVAQLSLKGVREVSRAAVIGHLNRRYEFS